MIELSSLTVIILLEVSLAFFVLLLIIFLLSKNKKKGEYVVSSEVIDKLQDTENIKAKKMQALIATHCQLAPEESKELIGEIKASERNLYQQIIQIFLAKDREVLKTIDKHIDGLAEPYCKLLSHANSGGVNSDKVKEDEEKMQKLMAENKQLAEQLTVAMNTMDEISAEYMRVFSGTQTELELDNSSKKMFKIFHQAGKAIEEVYQGEDGL